MVFEVAGGGAAVIDAACRGASSIHFHDQRRHDQHLPIASAAFVHHNAKLLTLRCAFLMKVILYTTLAAFLVTLTSNAQRWLWVPPANYGGPVGPGLYAQDQQLRNAYNAKNQALTEQRR